MDRATHRSARGAQLKVAVFGMVERPSPGRPIALFTLEELTGGTQNSAPTAPTADA
jgi:hypothetical protein